MTSIISIRLRNNETQAWYSKVLLQLNLLVIACLTLIKMSIAKGNSCNLEVWFGCPTFLPDFCPLSYGGTIQSIYYVFRFRFDWNLIAVTQRFCGAYVANATFTWELCCAGRHAAIRFFFCLVIKGAVLPMNQIFMTMTSNDVACFLYVHCSAHSFKIKIDGLWFYT